MTSRAPSPASPSPAVSRLLRPPEAASYLGLAQSTLAKLRVRGGGPLYVKLGARSVAYRLDDLAAWIAAGARRSTSDAE